jgi:four helix bundle protein
MDERKERLRQGTRDFAVRIIKLSRALPNKSPIRSIAEQLLRAGTSVGAHYAESCRSKSKADFINKICGAMQELEETIFWIHIVENTNLVEAKRLAPLKNEMTELMSIFVTMVKNSRANDAA